MTISSKEATNDKALKNARNRKASADALIDQITGKLGREYTGADQEKLEGLRDKLTKARNLTETETKLRERVKQAYDSSKFANKDADPAVKEAQKNLTSFQKDTKPIQYKGGNIVSNICQLCISSDINEIADCDTPYYYKYNKSGGPAYKSCHNHTIGTFAGWQDLIKSGVKTPSEKNVIIAMSPNEGDLDAVQAYDSETVSLGAMQKTVNPEHGGELVQQLKEFRDDPATKNVFDREIGSKGYSIGKVMIGTDKKGNSVYSKDDRLIYRDPNNSKAKELTGSDLRNFIRTHRDRWGDMLGPLRSIGRTPEFQRKQVLDFNDRLVNAMAKKPAGYEYSIGDYTTSELGGALVLDQDVNRPGWVTGDFSKALDTFYAKNKNVSKNPSDWDDTKRAGYEKEILDNYTRNRRGTDMEKRAENIKGSGISSAPGTLIFP